MQPSGHLRGPESSRSDDQDTVLLPITMAATSGGAARPEKVQGEVLWQASRAMPSAKQLLQGQSRSAAVLGELATSVAKVLLGSVFLELSMR